MKWNRIVAIAIAVLVLQPLRAQDPSLSSQYVHYLFRPESAARSAIAAGLDQANGKPSEWGDGMKGFGRRLGSAFGTHVVRSSIHFGVSKMLHEEFGYRRSEKQGFRKRLTYALLATVVTHKTTTGRPTVAVGSISGIVGGGLISRLWYPARFHTVGSGMASAGIGFGTEAGMNVLREFWPEIRHPRRRARTEAPVSP